MRVVIDIEANGLENPTKIWVICCKDIDTGEYYIFRKVTEDEEEKRKFLNFARGVVLWIGHNWLGYDFPHLSRLIGLDVGSVSLVSVDTLIVSKLIDYPRKRHSLEDYGREFNLPKIDHKDFSTYSIPLEEYCKRDIEITHKIYLKYLKEIFIKDIPKVTYVTKDIHNDNKDNHYDSNCISLATDSIHTNIVQKLTDSILLENSFQLLVNELHDNGFSFNVPKATKLLEGVVKELKKLDTAILSEFPPKEVLIREFTPKATKFGTISKTSVPRSLWDRISEYEVGQKYRHTRLVEFNPSSHKQTIEVLREAKWDPQDKTDTHIDTEREIHRLKYSRGRDEDVLEGLVHKLEQLKIYGWKINENNLSTLPPSAPSPARLLAKRILLESRRRTLTEWISLVEVDGRIHGKFYGIGAWTHRMAHQEPNTANIPNDLDTQGKKKLLGKEMRSLWQVPRNRLLVGVDAEGIQLRIFAHYIDDPEFTKALVEGKKEDKSDPHNLNKRILGDVCKDRAAAKRFVYALLLGAGTGKLAQILEASKDEAEAALARLMARYEGFNYLKKHIIPREAKRGWFSGLDGRRVVLPGITQRDREHLCMSGYLQNGEAIIMKMACILWHDMLKGCRELWKFVNFVHDEWQTECMNNLELAHKIAQTQCDAIRIVGEQLKLKCPLAGSFWNDDHKDYTIGTNWSVTH